MPRGVGGEKKRGPKRSKAQRLIEQSMVVSLLRRGYTQQQIADHLKVHQTQVSHDWKIVLKKLNEERDLDTALVKAGRLAQLDHIIYESIKAWEKSWEDSQKTVLSYSPYDDPPDDDPSGQPGQSNVRVTVTTEGRLPDPSYMTAALKAIDQASELQGLYPAKKVEAQITSFNWDVVSNTIPEQIPDSVEQKLQAALAGIPPSPPSVNNPILPNGLKEISEGGNGSTDTNGE
jgi:hypothetical protein